MLDLSLGLRLSGRNTARARIVVADGGVYPAIAPVSSGDPISAAFPATSLDTANYAVVGDDSDEVIEVILEWRRTRDGITEDWQSISPAVYADGIYEEGIYA